MIVIVDRKANTNTLLITFSTPTVLTKYSFLTDIIKEQNRELRGTQRAIVRDRAALEKQEKQLVSRSKTFHSKSTQSSYGKNSLCLQNTIYYLNIPIFFLNGNIFPAFLLI